MTADRWNEWLTLAANVGVVIGLGMLIFEVKHASDLAEVEAYQTRMTEISEAQKAVALSEDLAELLYRSRTEGVESLSEVERDRVTAWQLGVATRMQAQYYQYQRGFLDEASAASMLRAAAVVLPIWEALGVPIQNPEFLTAVKAVSLGGKPL